MNCLPIIGAHIFNGQKFTAHLVESLPDILVNDGDV